MVPLTIIEQDPCPPTLPGSFSPEVELWRDNDGAICAYGWTQGEAAWMVLPGLARFRIGVEDRQVTALAAPGVARALIVDGYYRSVLPMALQFLGYEALHASAVLGPRGLVAFCAVSHTGKSTTAYGLAQRGYSLWADDAVVVELDGTQARALPIPFALQLRPASAAWFGVTPADGLAAAAYDGRPDLREAAPLAALCVLKRAEGVDDPPVTCRRLAAADAFPAVLTHAYCFSLRNLGRKRQMLQHYLTLCSRTPVLEISFRHDLEALPKVLDAIEAVVQAYASLPKLEAAPCPAAFSAR